MDKNLFDESIVDIIEREQRINEIIAEKSEIVDFYEYKQFLAEKSLKDARAKLNAKGIKLSADVPCNLSYDEIWSHPKAFIKNATIGWGMPALDLESKEAEELIREKFGFYAKRFDGFRVDAAHTYISPIVTDLTTNKSIHKDYEDKFIKIIEDEVKKVKGNDFDIKNIKYEFACDPETFNIYDRFTLKPFIKDRVKIYTSDYLSNDWGSADNFVHQRGWSKDSFILGMTNHDSDVVKVSEPQVKALSSILKMPEETLKNPSEFLKAKFSEPMSAKNMMLFFMNALGMEGKYKDLPDKTLNYTAKVPEDYEDFYINSVKNEKGFNPMDALEKQFKAQGFDKTEPELYKEIIKYRDILQDKEVVSGKTRTPYMKIAAITLAAGVAIYGIYKLVSHKNQKANA